MKFKTYKDIRYVFSDVGVRNWTNFPGLRVGNMLSERGGGEYVIPQNKKYTAKSFKRFDA